MRIDKVIPAALLCGLIWPAAAPAADGWEFRATPYLWLPTLSSDLSIGAQPPASSDKSIFEVLEFGFLASGEVRKGDWGVFGEFNYLSLAQSATWGNRFGAEMSLRGAMGSAALAYRFARIDGGWADAFAGFRAWSVKPKINFHTLPTASKTISWVDPVIGLRGEYDFTQSVYASALADIGGFGTGSRFQWEVVGSLGYRFNDTISAELGYRHLAINFKDSSVDMDTAIRGPFVAVNFNF